MMLLTDAGVLMPEYLTCEDRSAEIARHLSGWLADGVQRTGLIARLVELREHVAHGGASTRAAEYILQALAGGPSQVPPPHYARAARVPQSHVG